MTVAVLVKSSTDNTLDTCTKLNNIGSFNDFESDASVDGGHTFDQSTTIISLSLISGNTPALVEGDVLALASLIELIVLLLACKHAVVSVLDRIQLFADPCQLGLVTLHYPLHSFLPIFSTEAKTLSQQVCLLPT